MAKDRGLPAGGADAQHQAKKLRQLFQVFRFPRNIHHPSTPSLPFHGYPQANPLGSIHHSTQACYFPCGEEGGHVDRLLADLPDIEFEGPDSHRMRIVAWSLAEANSLTRHEGVITKLPRKVVKREFTTRGCKYSGIFKIVSEFEGPDKSRYRAQGTAFAVNKSHVLTAAHNMWHPKLGPAKNATLFPDARAGMWAQYARKCIAAATSPNWVQVRQVEHDFCMVAVAEPFGPEVHILPCHPSPGPSHVKDGIILGFPLDLPCDAPGRHLIQCKGELSYHVDRDGIAIEHDINTKKGNSGGPVITSGQVVGIHTSFIHCERKNRAIVINRNGNNVGKFSNVLEYMEGETARLPRGFCRLEHLSISQSPRVLPIPPKFTIVGK